MKSCCNLNTYRKSCLGPSIALLMVLVLILPLILAAGSVTAYAEDPAAAAMPVLPGQGVDFQQVDFLFTEVIVLDSDWGRISVNPAELSDFTGISSGYLNVYTDAGWVVQNLPVDLSNGSDPITMYFSLGLAAPQDVSLLSAYVEFVPSPQLSFADGPRRDFPVGAVQWNAEGAGELLTTEVGPPPPPTAPPTSLGLFEVSQTTTKHTLPNAVNVQTAMNQCFPMSIANSLQYLENRFGINVPHDHKPGLRGDDTLVGQLDTKANRHAPARDSGSGVWFTPMLEGKFSYLAENGLKDKLIHKHQGRGYGSPPNQALPDGDLQSSGITSTDYGDKVTWEWICNEIKMGEDVEIVFSYDDENGNPTGGHAVRVFECGTTLGKSWLGYLHDRLQTNADPTDSRGLEMVREYTVDLDGDGILNLGSQGREIRFALSESVVEVDEFPDSQATIEIDTPLGSSTVMLTGPTTVHVFIGPDGQAMDTDGDGLDQVQTEIVQLELTGTSPLLGPVTARLRDPDKHPFQRSLGEIEEATNNTPGILDIPPFTATGSAVSFFDVFFEIEAPGAPPGLQLLHNEIPKHMRTTITHKPPDSGETYESPERIPLLDELGLPTGVEIAAVSHTPNPPARDFGDAPDPPYPTSWVSGGAYHGDFLQEWLGMAVDGESDAKFPDNFDDGVILKPWYRPFRVARVPITISTSGLGAERYGWEPEHRLYLRGWIDYNMDGDWDDPGELVVDCDVAPGTTGQCNKWPANWKATQSSQTFIVKFNPALNAQGWTWARFRLSYGAPVGPTGPADYGEVEDYPVGIFLHDP